VLFLLIPLANAGIVSVNSGGSQTFLINPNIIEGFPFGVKEELPVPGGGGGVTGFSVESSLGGICNLSQEFILKHERDNKLIFTENELENLKIDLKSKLLVPDLTNNRLLAILIDECLPSKKKPTVFPLLIILLILGLVVFIYQNRKKTFMVVFVSKLKKIKKLKIFPK